ncbi:MAG: RNA polymerase sigma factor [Gammaproteobacteria bacterium]
MKGLARQSEIRERRSPERLAIDRADAQQLIQRYCNDHDNDSFTTFYKQQSHRLWRFLVARGCNEELAYDILSESFLKFSQSICKDPHSPVAYLFRIAINLYIDDYRKGRNNPLVNDNEQVERASGKVSQSIDSNDDLHQLIKQLPDIEQNMLLMRYWLGLTHKEVAKAVGLPEGTVRRQTAELLKLMQEKLNQSALMKAV